MMIHNLGLDPTKFRKVRTPISCPVMDFTPLSPDEAKLFMSGTGMIGWLAVTGRPDLRYCHSRISQHLATPTRGALANLLHVVRYCFWSKSLSLSGRRRGGATGRMAAACRVILISRETLNLRINEGHSLEVWPCSEQHVRFSGPQKEAPFSSEK